VAVLSFEDMKQIRTALGKTGVLLFVGFVSTCSMNAVTSQQLVAPYHGIVERNVFDLRAPVIRAKEPSVKPIVLSKITLTGITTIFGRTIAFMTIAGDRPGQLPESVMLAEGQTFHDIEVKTIDCKGGIVQIINHGAAQILGFDTACAKAPDSPVPPEQPSGLPSPPKFGPRSEALSSPEEQVALIEIQREKYRQKNDPVGDLLPPTEMASESAGNASALP
jgi:hypothetical protein